MKLKKYRQTDVRIQFFFLHMPLMVLGGSMPVACKHRTRASAQD